MRSIVLPVRQQVDEQVFRYLPNKSSWSTEVNPS